MPCNFVDCLSVCQLSIPVVCNLCICTPVAKAGSRKQQESGYLEILAEDDRRMEYRLHVPYDSTILHGYARLVNVYSLPSRVNCIFLAGVNFGNFGDINGTEERVFVRNVS